MNNSIIIELFLLSVVIIICLGLIKSRIISLELLFDIAAHWWLSCYVLVGVSVFLHCWYKNRGKTLLMDDNLGLGIDLIVIFCLRLMPLDFIQYHIHLYRDELFIWVKVYTKLLVSYIMVVWLLWLCFIKIVHVIVFLFSPL